MKKILVLGFLFLNFHNAQANMNLGQFQPTNGSAIIQIAPGTGQGSLSSVFTGRNGSLRKAFKKNKRKINLLGFLGAAAGGTTSVGGGSPIVNPPNSVGGGTNSVGGGNSVTLRLNKTLNAASLIDESTERVTLTMLEDLSSVSNGNINFFTLTLPDLDINKQINAKFKSKVLDEEDLASISLYFGKPCFSSSDTTPAAIATNKSLVATKSSACHEEMVLKSLFIKGKETGTVKVGGSFKHPTDKKAPRGRFVLKLRGAEE